MNIADCSPDIAGNVNAVVGIGASAGGLEALEAFFDTAPDDAGLAYVVVTHLSPNFKSLMDELLARHTKMAVQLVDDGMVIQPNQVYVIPPNSEMIVVAGRLLLSDREPGPQIALPIDTFFYSLARDYGERAAAIILSGTGGDGSHALESMRSAGGSVFVQDPDTAKFDGMPKAAISTGQANDILSPAEIGRQIQELIARLPRSADPVVVPSDPEGEALRRIFSALFGSSSIDFEAYKTSTVLRRIDRRIASTRSDTIRNYADLITQDRGEAEALSRDLLIGVTEFFRDDEAFRRLSEDVIPELIASKKDNTNFRIWCAGCATGEEAYSIAMLIRRELDRSGRDCDVQIFATDLQRDFVDHAGRGVFPTKAFPADWEDVWSQYTFDAGQEQRHIAPEVRRMVVFAHHNVLSDPPFTRLDLITCRNMLTYFQPEAQDQALGLISFGLRRGGYLFLGPSESLGETHSNFTVIHKRWRIYRKEHDALGFHVPDRTRSITRREKNTPMPLPQRTPSRQRKEMQILPAYSAMLDRFAPPSILIDGDRQLVHTFGSAREFLRPPVGLATLDILDMVPDGLKLPVATAIDRVNREGIEVRYEGASAGSTLVDLTVFPTIADVDGRRGHKVILLEHREGGVDDPKAIEVLGADSIALARISDLEGELRYTRENLQATIEEVETSNEELQSTNEELMAANEELQSTNEELHSVNEELYSVNAEYQSKNDELIQLNRDMEALMGATDVGVVFVDEELTIRRFTEPAKRVFNLITEDKGRSLSHMTHRLVDADVPAIARRAVEQFISTDLEFEGGEGDWWLLRCMPMRTPGSSAIGAIITLFEISERKRAELRLGKELQRNSLITSVGNAFVFSTDANLGIADPSDGWKTYTGQGFEEHRGKGWLQAIHPDDRDRVAGAMPEASSVSLRAPHKTLYRLYDDASGEHRHCQAHLVPALDADENVTGWDGVVVDVEDAVQSEQAYRQSEQLIRSIMNDMPGLFAMLDADRRYIFANSVYEERWNNGDGLIGQRVDDVLPPDVLSAISHHLEGAYRGESQEFMFERRGTNDKIEVILGIYAPTKDSSGAVSGVSVFGMNIREAIDSLKSKISIEEALGRTLIDGDDEYLIVDSKSRSIMRSSKGAEANLNRSTVELTRMSLPDLLPEYPADRIRGLVQNLRSSGRTSLQLDTFVLRGDGSTYDATVKLARSPAEYDGHLIVTIDDRTGQIATKNALRSRNEELARSNSDLESFARFASHDLKEPARKIGNFAELIIDDIGADLNEEAREYLDIIKRSSDRMMTLVQDLLNFSRVRAGDNALSEVDLGGLLDGIAKDLAPDLKQVGGSMDVGPMPTISGDSGLLTQLFVNLVGNSIKYREPSRPLSVSIIAEQMEDGHRISIRDNGLGFDSDDATQIFGLFQRLHSPTSITGSGVGLAICERVVELHGGTIEAEGKPGEGACFTIRLPFAKAS